MLYLVYKRVLIVLLIYDMIINDILQIIKTLKCVQITGRHSAWAKAKTKTVKQSIYFYVYISYNKNISYIVTVTLKLLAAGQPCWSAERAPCRVN